MQQGINSIKSNFKACPKHLYSTDKHIHCRDCDAKQPRAPKKVKAGVLATTILGVGSALALSFKRKGFSIKPNEIFNSMESFKNSGLAKINYSNDVVVSIATGSICGGLLGGYLFDDKKNMKAKLREAAIQLLSNVLIPLICVDKGSKLFKSMIKAPLMKKYNLVEQGASATKLGKTAAGIFDVAALFTSLGTAIFVGNRVSNFINEKIYNIRDDRNVKVADLSGHVDDTCLAISKSFEGDSPIAKFSNKVSRIIPLALLVCGYSSGIMQEWPDDIKATRKVNPNKAQL